MNTKQIGELSEAIIIVELMKFGYIVSKPIGDNQRYDLVIEDKTGNLLKCQCKTAQKNEGAIKFNTSNVNWNSGGYVVRNYRDSCDLFLVYSPDTMCVYKIPVGECGNRSFSLHIEKTKKYSNKNIRWADDYRLK